MPDPFAAGLAALFAAPGSAAAVYTPARGATLPGPIRVIIGAPDDNQRLLGGEATVPTPRAEVRRSDAPGLGAGDRLDLLADDGATVTTSYVILGQPLSDIEGLTWFADVAPA